MIAATRVGLAEASAIAEQLRAALAPGCERIEVAGSIRRRRPDVGDIELVAVPRIHVEDLAEGLFETRELTVDELQVTLDQLLMDGVLASHPTDPKRGPRYSKWLHVASGLQVDLFSARRDTFGLIWLIRTGPDTYSRALVTDARRRGHHVAGGEVHKGAGDCRMPFVACEVIPTPEEGDVIRALGIGFLSDPALRQ